MSIDHVRVGLKAAGLWTLVEFAIRYGVILVAGGGFVLLSGKFPKEADVEPFVGTAAVVTLTVAAVVLAVIFKRRAATEQLGLNDLAYRFGPRYVLAGFVAGLSLFLVAWGTAYIDAALFPNATVLFDLTVRLIVSGGPVTTVALLVANGILGPVVEEYAWRGYIQYRLTRAWGARAGLVATSLLFAAKHVVVDLSFGRAMSLLVGGLGLGVIRHRWGTTASTAAHITVNLLATFYLLVTPRN